MIARVPPVPCPAGIGTVPQMEQDTVTTTETAETTVPADTLVADELLVEEISIDGMCGVY